MSPSGGTGARIFLADDHPAVLDGLSMLLAQHNHTICGVAANRAETLRHIPGSRADIILLDLGLCGESGLDLLPECNALGLPSLVYSMHEDSATVRRALERGAAGYVTKREPSAVLLEAVRQVLAGVVFISPRAIASLREEPAAALDAHSLSEREQQIMELLAHGETNAEIAAALEVSVRTVETYCSRILNKLGLDGMKTLRKHAIQMSRRT